MNKLDNYIFNCGIDKTLFDELCKSVSTDYYVLAYDCSNNPSNAVNCINASSAKSKLGAYVVLTDNAESCNGMFVSNNIIVPGNRPSAAIVNDIKWVMSGFGRNRAGTDMFVVSDTHFWHKNIIRYCNRPWMSGFDNGTPVPTDADMLKMNEDMIQAWNSVVGKNDIVYHLGDFSFGGKDKAKCVRPRLNGRIRLVLGNHDKLKVKEYYDMGFDRVYDTPILIKNFIILSHEPLQWVKDPMFNIYGHVHDCAAYPTITKNSCCVCVERWNYKPVSVAEIERQYSLLDK